MNYFEFEELPENNNNVLDESIFYADYYDTSNNDILHNLTTPNYELLTVKQLMRIHEYYIPKSKKQMKKCDIIYSIVVFETNPNNNTIVMKRNHLWNTISELKKDNYMKQFIFWS
jgi:hypothetical protein